MSAEPGQARRWCYFSGNPVLADTGDIQSETQLAQDGNRDAGNVAAEVRVQMAEENTGWTAGVLDSGSAGQRECWTAGVREQEYAQLGFGTEQLSDRVSSVAAEIRVAKEIPKDSEGVHDAQQGILRG